MAVSFHQDGRVTRNGDYVGHWSRGGDGYVYNSALGGSVSRKHRSDLIPLIEQDKQKTIGNSRMVVPRSWPKLP